MGNAEYMGEQKLSQIDFEFFKQKPI